MAKTISPDALFTGHSAISNAKGSYAKFSSGMACAALSLLLLAGAWIWLVQPFSHNIWRIRLSLPVLGSEQISGHSLLQLATSPLLGLLLNNSNWPTRYGVVTIHSKPDSLELVCQNCALTVPGLSKQTLHIDRLSVSIQRNGQHVSGWLSAARNSSKWMISYAGTFDRHGFALNWSLPKTQISQLVAALKEHSSVVRRARIRGFLAASGTLSWPDALWTIHPEVESFGLEGLGTAQLNTASISYHCPSHGRIGPRQPDQWLSNHEMGRWLPRAVIIAEDAHFKEHPGYNLEAIRSILSQSNRGRILGGSTLSQQLAKNFFTGGERTWLRKLEELLYAVEMETTLGKHRIFNLYLNTVDWGPGICGAAQASQVYFHRKPEQLTAIEAVWLAGIIRNPHRAWTEQFLTHTPDMARISRIMGFMPKSARTQGLTLRFAR